MSTTGREQISKHVLDIAFGFKAVKLKINQTPDIIFDIYYSSFVEVRIAK